MVEKLKKYRCTYISDQGNKFDADVDENSDGEFFKVEDVEVILNSVQQRYAKIADSIDAASGSVHMTLPGLKLFCVEWSRQLRQ